MRVLVTPRSFGKADATPLNILKDAGVEIVANPKGGILSEDELIAALDGCDGVVIGVDPLTDKVIQSANKLRAIAKYGVGTDNIDLEAARARGIPVSRTVGANAKAVADYAFAMMLAAARRVIPIDAMCRKGQWGKQLGTDVCGKTLGLIGLGAIGREMVKRAHGFDMTVIAEDTFWDAGYAAENQVMRTDIPDICKRADFISLHVPLTSETRGLIGADELALMKPTAILINTARGGLIDEDALLAALKERRIYAAGLDAFEKEPPDDDAWFTLDNVVLGSHAGASTDGAATAMGVMAARNLIKDLKLLEDKHG